MIYSIEILGYKALEHVSAKLLPFQILVGPNASGKSTFFDALHLVRDVLIAGVDRAILGDARLEIPVRAADPIELSWLRCERPVEIVITALIPEDLRLRSTSSSPYSHARYEISIDLINRTVFYEALFLIPEASGYSTKHAQSTQLPLFPLDPTPPQHIISLKKRQENWRMVVKKTSENGNDYFKSEKTKWNNIFRFGTSRPALSYLPEDNEKFPIAIWLKQLLMEGVQRIALNAEQMRLPSPAGSPKTYLPDGSNLPWVVHDLEANNKDNLALWLHHIRTVLPDIKSIETIERPEDRSRYILVTYMNGLRAPSWVLSDGTLRFLALTLLAYAKNTPPIILIEEPENGIHPKGIEGIISSLRSTYNSQVFCATHSSIVLSLASPKDLLCFGKTERGAVDIRSGENHPNLQKWKQGLNIGDLFASGVLG